MVSEQIPFTFTFTTVVKLHHQHFDTTSATRHKENNLKVVVTKIFWCVTTQKYVPPLIVKSEQSTRSLLVALTTFVATDIC